MHRFLLGREELCTHCNILFCYECFPAADSTLMLRSDREMDRFLVRWAPAFAATACNNSVDLGEEGWGEAQDSTSTFPTTSSLPRQKQRSLADLQ